MNPAARGPLALRSLARFAPCLLVFVFALFVRVPGLDSRPMHTDEAVNAFILEETLSYGMHRYRTHDHHGPTLYYAAAGLLAPAGLRRTADFEAWHLRLVPALCGAGLAAAAFLFRPWLGSAATLAAALALAFAAPFVYYSGTFIHETLLLLLFAGWLAAFWRWRESDQPRYAALAGALAGLLLATKETAALLIALFVLTGLVGLRFAPPRSANAARPRRFLGLALQATVALAVVALLFSGFGREPAHALDLFRAIGAQTGRGLGAEHSHPWFTYLRWAFAPSSVSLPWAAWLLGFGAVLGLWRHRREAFARWLGSGGALVFIAFSSLPYKTPWLMLAWLLPLTLLAGLGAATVWLSLRHRPALRATAALVVLTLLATETTALCLRQPVNPGNPLAYSPTSPDVARLENDLAAQPADALIQVVAQDYWPLPWTLRRHNRVGYWSEAPAQLAAGLFLAGPEQLGALPSDTAPLEPYELRPGVLIFLGRILR